MDDDFVPLRMYCYFFDGFLPVDAFNPKRAFYRENGNGVEIFIGREHPKHSLVVHHEMQLDRKDYSDNRRIDSTVDVEDSPDYTYTGSKVVFDKTTGDLVVQACDATEFSHCRAGVVIPATHFTDIPCWRGSGIRCASKTYKRQPIPEPDDVF